MEYIMTLLLNFMIAVTSTVNSSSTLWQTINLAWEHSEEVKSAVLNYEKSKLEVDEYWGTFAPKITGYWNYQRNPEVKVTFSPHIPQELQALLGNSYKPESVVVRPSENYEMGLKLMQKIFDPSMIPGLKITNLYREMAELGLQKTKEMVAYLTTNLYLQLLFLTKQKDVLLKEDSELEIEKKKTEDEISLGLQPEWSKLRIDIEIQRHKKSLMEVETMIRYVSSELERLTGRKIFPAEPPVPSSLNKSAFSTDESVDLKITSLQKELSHQMWKVQVGRLFPRINFMWNYSYQKNPGNFGKKENWMVMLQLTWTIFSGLSRYYEIRESSIDEEIAGLDLTKRKKEAEIKLKRAIDEFFQQKKLLEVSRRTFDLARKNFSLVEENYKNGKADVITYIDARNNLLKAKLSLIWNRYQLLLKRMNVYILSGKLEQFMEEIRQ